MTTKKTAYTTTKASCLVYNIEFVVPIAMSDAVETVERALATLRCTGAAEVINKYAVAEHFDQASDVLINRAFDKGE